MSLMKLYYTVRDAIVREQRSKEHRDRVRTIAPKYVLTKEQEKQIRDFYGPYCKVDMWFHNFYYQATGEFHPEYVPDNLHYCFIDPYYNNWHEAIHVDNKCYYRRMYHGILQPEEIANRVGGTWFVGDYEPITRQELDAVLAKEPEIVVKAAMGSQGGKGVYFVKGTDFAKVEGRIRDDITIQRPIVQHPDLAAINPTSVNTIRIISLLTDGKAKIYSSILRIGINGARVDNASSGGITCGITADGTLKKHAYNLEGTRWDAHPDTGVVFEGYGIPSFQKCMDMVQKLHVQVPHFRLVSWDFSVTEAGEPLLVEANVHYGQPDFHQLNNGPLFGEDTEKILKEVFAKK